MILITRRQMLAGTSALSLSSLPSRAQEGEPVGMQLILAADVSGSVNETRYAVQQQGYLRGLRDPRVLATIRNLDPPVLGVTFIAWAASQAVMVPWTRVHDARSMSDFCAALEIAQRPTNIGIGTFIADALQYCHGKFDTAFSGGRRVIDISGDGSESRGIVAHLRAVRDTLVNQGVIINGLPIIVKPPEYIRPPQPPEGLDVYYRNHVVGGAGHVMIESVGFDNFYQAILQKLLLEIG
jgi:Protein of unknown function (DUF1194)